MRVSFPTLPVHMRTLQGLTDATTGRGVAAGGGAAGGGGGRAPLITGGEELPGPPVIPEDVLAEAIPGNIRNAELFVRFMKYIVKYLKVRRFRV